MLSPKWIGNRLLFFLLFFFFCSSLMEGRADDPHGRHPPPHSVVVGTVPYRKRVDGVPEARPGLVFLRDQFCLRGCWMGIVFL